MSSGELFISQLDLDRIEASAQSSLPRESCGIMLGAQNQDGWHVSGIVESRNIAPDDRTDRFEIDPALLLRVQKAARAGGPRMIGVYHSHPGGKAEPSSTDLETSWQSGMIWVITSVNGAAVETRAFLREAMGFVPVPLQMMDMES